MLRHRGSQREVVQALKVTPTAVSAYLYGRSKSARIEAACLAKAQELLRGEAKCAA